MADSLFVFLYIRGRKALPGEPPPDDRSLASEPPWGAAGKGAVMYQLWVGQKVHLVVSIRLLSVVVLGGLELHRKQFC